MSFKKKLICVDMDGTLLTNDNKITDKTKNYLRDLQTKGHYIVITSGRPYRAIKDYYNSIGLTTPVICGNGANIVLPKSNKVLFSIKYPTELIYKTLKEIGINNFENIMVEDDLNNLYMLNEGKSMDTFNYKDGMNVHYGDMTNKIEGTPTGVIFELKNSKYKAKMMKLCYSYSNIGLRFWENSNFGELYFTSVNKHTAICEVADLLGINKDNTICFGDAANDIEMIDKAGIGVSMINGERSVKNYSSLCSLEDNNHDGVIETLKLLLAAN